MRIRFSERNLEEDSDNRIICCKNLRNKYLIAFKIKAVPMNNGSGTTHALHGATNACRANTTGAVKAFAV